MFASIATNLLCQVTTIAGSEKGDELGDCLKAAKFNGPRDMAVDSEGSIFIADCGNAKIKRLRAGEVTVVAGEYVHDPDSVVGFLHYPAGLVFAPDTGALWFSDAHNYLIRSLNNGVITTVAGTGIRGFKDGALRDDAQVNCLNGMLFAPDGALYLTDTANHCIRKLHDGQITTVAGRGIDGYQNSTRGTAAEFCWPIMSALEPTERKTILIADQFNYCVRQMDLATTEVSTIIGPMRNKRGHNDGPVASALFQRISCVVPVDRDTIYIADPANHVIRVVQDGYVATIGCGKEGMKDGSSNEAQFNHPASICIAPDGKSILVADTLNHCIRMISRA